MTHSPRGARRTLGRLYARGRTSAPWRTGRAVAPALLVAVASLLVACSATGPTGTPPPVRTLPASPTPATTPPPQSPPSGGPASPSAPPTGAVRNAAEAAARVIASDPRFTGVQALSPNIIGASAWYEVESTADGYRVAITVGWGDCMAGCISRHVWIFEVAADGAISLAEESGDPFQGGVFMPPVAGDAQVDVELVAGPGCAVDPGCGGRPAVNAMVHFLDPFGTEVTTLTSDFTGHAKGLVPAGTYVVVADPVGAGQTAPEPIAASIVGDQIVYLRFAFDDPAG